MAAPTRRQAKRRISKKSVETITSLISNNRPDDAIARLDKLLRQHPENAIFNALYGRALQQQEQYDDALSSFRKALHIGMGENTNKVRLDVVACLLKKEQFADAAELTEQVLAHDPDNARALSLRGAALAQAGEPTQARHCLEHLKQAHPDNPLAYQGLAHLVTFDANSRVFEVMERALKKDSLTASERADLHVTLGKAFLDIGQDDDAFREYAQANKVMDEDLSPSRAQIDRRLQFTRTTFTRPLFETLSPYGSQTRPQIIVTGMSRSGKSLVESLFEGVAGVERAGEDTTLGHYVNDVVAPYGGRVPDWLTAQTPASTRAHAEELIVRMGVGSTTRVTTLPGNLWSLGFIGLWQPNVPIIFCLRGMLDLGVTSFFQHYNLPRSFRYSYNLHHLGREIAGAERVMEHWAQVLPNPVYLVEYEALVRDPDTVAANLLSELGLERAQSWEAITGDNADLVDDLGPIMSLNTVMPMTDHFIGFGERFRDKLEPMIAGYKTIADKFPRQETPTALPQALPEALYDSSDEARPSETVNFDWQLSGQLMVLDNGGRLLRTNACDTLLEMEAFGLVTLDPAAELQRSAEQRDQKQLQYIPQAVLGDGQPGTLHACLDASYTSTLAPRPAEQLPDDLRQATRVITRLPVSTLKLDEIDGLGRLDWLLLDARHDNLGVLTHGQRLLADTLLLHIGILFQPVYAQQSGFAELLHWAAAHGFRFHGFVDFTHDQDMPARNDVRHQPRGTRLHSAQALFVPNQKRMAALHDDQRLKLAFMLDTVYQIHDTSYKLLRSISADLAESYLKARGFFDRYQSGPTAQELKTAHDQLMRGDLYTPQAPLKTWQKRYPNDARVHSVHAQITAGFGKYPLAIDYINKALGQAPDDLAIWLSGVSILLQAGMWWEAWAALQPLMARYPEHIRLRQFNAEMLTLHPDPDRNTVEVALQHLADMPVDGDLQSTRMVSIQAQLLARLGQMTQAKACHERAVTQASSIPGPVASRAFISQADTLHETGEPDASCDVLWQACDSHPYSMVTVEAYRKFSTRLGQCSTLGMAALAPLHKKLKDTWDGYRQEKLKYSFGDFGLPYQGFEPLKIPGSRPAMHRLAIYQLAQDLPQNARALDIGCNHGFLLLGLADQLSYGKGFDISQSCIDVGNIVARHMGLSHIDLTAEPFDDFVCKKPFDLVIACAVHHWIGVPLAEFGAKLYKYCKPGGIVLVESQGKRSTRVTEPDFDDKVQTMASAGFEVIRTGSLCDDAINYRKFQILRKVH